jgi:DNA-binding NtrC family response regulator
MSFERVGSSQTLKVDVRVVAATHQDLEALMRSGRFREDLYYRLDVITLRTPPLRERADDLFELALHFLGVYARRLGKPVTQIDDAAVEAIAAYPWPGNVRELENAIERAVVFSEGDTLHAADLPAPVAAARRRSAAPARHTPSRPLPALAPSGTSLATRPRRIAPAPVADAPEDLDAELHAYERHRLLDALEEARGNKSEAARLLGMPRSTFFSRLRKHRLI